MLHVALKKLTSRGPQNVVARDLGLGVHKRHDVLQLITKAIGTAALVQPHTRPHPTGQRLIQRPLVQHRIERTIGRAHGNHAQALVPCLARRSEGCGCTFGRTQLTELFICFGFGGGRTQQHRDFARLTGRERDLALQRGARIESHTNFSTHRTAAEGQRIR